MANAIALAQLYKAALDRIYILNSLSVSLEGNTGFVLPTDDPQTVKVAMMALQGLADYSRANGYVGGDVTLDWQLFQLTHDRGRSFQVDAMDDREALFLPLLNLVNMFMLEHVVPEIDAIRFSTMADRSALGAAANIADTAAAVAAWKKARQDMDEAEVPESGRIAFMSMDYYYKLEGDKVVRERLRPGEGSDSRFQTLDGITVVKVPQNRFYSAITLRTGASGQEAGGYTKGASGVNLNFQIVHRPAVSAVTKHEVPRIFGPTVNQAANATKFDYRIYHDLFVPDNKTKGIYTHKATA